jgi:hypothetical protein
LPKVNGDVPDIMILGTVSINAMNAKVEEELSKRTVIAGFNSLVPDPTSY